ncbi:short chain dehydrogenase family protein [Mycobacterium kansasii 732]|nr:short chain dehydrogenase family protein [Mycobacterium kansasii 732]
MVTGDIADPGTADRLVQAVEAAGFRLAGVLHSAMVLADEIVLNMTDSAAARGFRSEGRRQLAAASGHGVAGCGLVAHLLLGCRAARHTWARCLRRRELLGRRPGRVSALPRTARGRNQLGPMGRGRSRAVLRRSGRVDDHRRAGTVRDAGGARRRSGAHRCVQPGRPAVVPILPRGGRSSLFAKLQESTAPERSGGGKVRAQLDALDAAERPGYLASAIAGEIRGVLRSSDPIDHDRPLETLGLDSLMALELRNRLEASLGITLPVALVWAYPTITDLAAALCERMDYAPPAAAQQTADAEPELSDEEMDLLADLVEASELEAAARGES